MVEVVNKKKNQKEKHSELICYFIAVCSSLLILIWGMQLWRADLSIPFSYSGDVSSIGLWIKSLIDGVWYFHNNFVGMPFGLDMYDFPISSNFDFFLIKIMSLFSTNYAVLMNLFYLSTFPLTTISTVFVLRKLKISFSLSIFGSLLFTFVPYHFLRGEGHFLFSQYFLLPLIILVILRIFENPDLFFTNRKLDETRKFLINRKSIFCIIVCILIGSTCVYYAFFSCFFLLIAGLYAYFNHNKQNSFSALFFIVLIVVVGLINLSPTIVYQHENGPNPTAWLRTPAEAEVYGLKIIQLLLPIQNHFIPQFAAISDYYSRTAPLVNENSTASLGLIGSIGFLLLIGGLLFGKILFFEKDGEKYQKLFTHISILNISALLLGTIGGIGAIFAYVFPYYRGYNRISIFIAFFSMLSIIIYLQIIADKYKNTRKIKILFVALLIGLLIFGIMDTTNKYFVPSYDSIKNEYLSDEHLVNQIESTLPDNSMIFQLPYVQFLGGTVPNKIDYYDPLKPYLHSKTLRWSYGAMINRPGDLWQREISDQSLGEMVESLSLAGFSGIWIDTYGYANPDQIITNLYQILGTNPIFSENKRYYFFDMRAYNENLKSNMTGEEYNRRQFSVLHPLIPEWGTGFSVYEGNSELNWRWAASKGILILNNPTQENRAITIDTIFRTGWSEYANITIKTESFSENIIANNQGTHYEKRFVIPPGQYIISFISDARRVDAPSDPRNLVFRVDNFKLREIFLD
jgi:phosphoglycerol transferase